LKRNLGRVHRGARYQDGTKPSSNGWPQKGRGNAKKEVRISDFWRTSRETENFAMSTPEEKSAMKKGGIQRKPYSVLTRRKKW